MGLNIENTKNPLAPTSQPPKKVSLDDGRQVYWLTLLPSISPSRGYMLQWILRRLSASTVAGTAPICGFPIKPITVPFHRSILYVVCYVLLIP